VDCESQPQVKHVGSAFASGDTSSRLLMDVGQHNIQGSASLTKMHVPSSTPVPQFSLTCCHLKHVRTAVLDDQQQHARI
jgi:hypothetical protein